MPSWTPCKRAVYRVKKNNLAGVETSYFSNQGKTVVFSIKVGVACKVNTIRCTLMWWKTADQSKANFAVLYWQDAKSKTITIAVPLSSLKVFLLQLTSSFVQRRFTHRPFPISIDCDLRLFEWKQGFQLALLGAILLTSLIFRLFWPPPPTSHAITHKHSLSSTHKVILARPPSS